jgi:7,8-dihydroneopterin aldolase/epimerase/oxygenase
MHRAADPMSTSEENRLLQPAAFGRGYRRVFVRDLEIVASVGLLEREKRYDQRILVSTELLVRDEYDGTSDRLGDVLDYSKVIDGMTHIIQREHVNLIETLAERIAEFCLTDPRVEMVRVKIEKPEIIENCRSVGVEIERRRT